MLSCFVCSGLVVWAHTSAYSPVFSTFEVTNKNEDSEKNITSVKVMYNPIAEQINANFKLSKQSNLSIKLMDALGNEVLALANNTYDEGTHSLSFETEGKISPGFYFVKLKSGTETVIKRISIR